MRFDANDSAMFRQRQHHPITKVFIQCDENALVASGPVENQRIIRARLTGLTGSHYVVAMRTQRVGEIGPQHLVEIKTHGNSGRLQNGEFGVQHGLTGIIQGRLNVGPGQFRIGVQKRVPRLAGRQLFEESNHRNPCTFDNRLAAAYARVDFDTVVHGLTIRETPGKRKAASCLDRRTRRIEFAAPLWDHRQDKLRRVGRIVPNGLPGHLHGSAGVRILTGVQIPIPQREIAAGDFQADGVTF